MVARGSYWWPDDETMAYMVERGFSWDKVKLCFLCERTGRRRVIAQYTNWDVSGALMWEWVERSSGWAQKSGFDSAISAYVNAELAGWEIE